MVTFGDARRLLAYYSHLHRYYIEVGTDGTRFILGIIISYNVMYYTLYVGTYSM